MTVAPDHEDLVRHIGLADPFADPRVRVWRSLPDRENATLDTVAADGSALRLHVKRYPPSNRSAMAAEVRGHGLLTAAGIPTAPLVAHGAAPDGRSFAAFLDLAGYAPGDKWLAANPGRFDALLAPTADLAAALHAAGLHHRDLYLCHFMVRPDPPDVRRIDVRRVDVRLIDVTRVARLSNPLTRRRWLVKDLAQFWYSTTKHADVTDAHRMAWLAWYARTRATTDDTYAAAVRRKAAAIARHDVKLNRDRPTRNVSLPVRG